MTVADMFTDPAVLAYETRLAAAEVRVAALERQVRRLRDDRDHFRRRLQAAEAVVARHNPVHGHRVLLRNLSYVLGSSRDHTNHQQGDQP